MSPASLPALRARVRRRHRGQRPRRSPGAPPCCRRFLRRVRACGARGCARRRPRPRPLAAVRDRGAGDGEAVRRDGVGHGRRARGARAGALQAGRLPRALRDLLRRRRSPTRCAGSARARWSSCRPGSRSRSRSGPPTIRRTSSTSGRLSEEKGVEELAEATRGRSAGGRRRRAAPEPLSRRGGFRAAARTRAVLRASGDRRLSVAPRGLRRRRARGDGARPAGRRGGGRRPRRRRRGRRDGPARASGRPAGVCASRSSGCSAMRRFASASGRRRESASSNAARGKPATDATLAVYGDVCPQMPERR